ncbi:MAG: DUF4136 domain-containing protein [Pseudomonadota bacterium]
MLALVRTILRAPAFLAFGAVVLTGCASGPKTVVDYDSSVDFAEYETFGWAGDDPVDTDGVNRTISPFIKQEIQDAVAAELAQKGYAMVADKAEPDFRVLITLGRRDQIEIDTFAETQYSYVPRTGRATAYAPGVYGYGYKTTGQTVEQFTEGSISIDIFDSSVGRPVWFGHASDEVDPLISRNQARDLVLEAIPLILEPFPPEDS